MEIGIGAPNMIPVDVAGSLIVDWAQRAEARGLSTIAAHDRVAYPNYDTVVTVAASAAVTSRIELMTNVMISPLRNPFHLAKQAASIDQISGGRFTLGLGVGSRKSCFLASDQDYETRGKRFERDVAIMQRIWNGEEFYDDVASPPTVRGRIPLLIGGIPGPQGLAQYTIDRIVKLGTGYTAPGLPPEYMGPVADQVRQAWADAGRSGSPRIVNQAYMAMNSDDHERGRDYIRSLYRHLPDMVGTIVDSIALSVEMVQGYIRANGSLGVDTLIFQPTVPEIREVDLLADAAALA